MADSIEAVAAVYPAPASRLMREILKYYGEDPDAVWSVYPRIVANTREPVEE
jgi:hypothetical protein